MKTSQIKEDKEEILGSVEESGYDSSIADGKEQKMFAILSENLYSDPYGSIVRELTSNAVDATVEAGNTEPVMVGFETDETGTSLIIKDNGVGISKDRAKNVFAKMLASTKEDSADQIGSWGLGRLSAFSYTDMFYVLTNYKGVNYTYVMVKKELGFRMELMNEVPTEEPNGTTIKIPINYGDKGKFETAIKEQLAYFNNIYYVGIDVDNDYKIYEGKSFKFNNRKPISRIHICLGNVYYPINHSKVGIPADKEGNRYNDGFESNCSVGLKFNIAELPVTPSRENILYTDEAVKAINNKYKEFLAETEELYNRKAEDTDNLEEVYKSHQNSIKNLYLGEEDYICLNRHNSGNLNITNWKKWPKLRLGSTFALISNCLIHTYKYSHNIEQLVGYNTNVKDINDKSNHSIIYEKDEELIAKKKRYLSSVGYKTCVWAFDDMKEGDESPLKRHFNLFEKINYYNKKSLVKALGLRKYPKDKWRAIIQDVIQWYKDTYWGKLDKISTVKIPDSFEPKAEYINYEALRKSEGKILLHIGRRSEHWSYDGVGTVYDKYEPKIKELHSKRSYRKLIIYGKNSDKEFLDKLELLTRGNPNILIVKAASKNYKIIEQFPNFIHCDKIKKMIPNEYPAVCRSLTVLYVKSKLDKSDNLWDNIKILDHLNPQMGEEFREVWDFKQNNSSNWEMSLNEVEKEWLEFAESHNLLNLSIKEKTDRVSLYIQKIDFLHLLEKEKYGKRVILSDDMLELIVDVCKQRRLKLHYSHYQEKIEFEEAEIYAESEKDPMWIEDDGSCEIYKENN